MDTIGPKIIARPEPQDKPTGIRKTAAGDWCAIRNGRLIDSFVGPGAKAAAIRANGGCNRVIA